MSKNQNNLNDIIRNKFNEQEIPFEEADWKNMRRTIDAKRAAKKRTGLYIISAAALLLCLGTVGLLNMSKNNGKVDLGGQKSDMAVNNNASASNSNAIASTNSVNDNASATASNNNNVTQDPVTTKPAINENTASPTTSTKSDLGSQKSEVASNNIAENPTASHRSTASPTNYQSVATSKHVNHSKSNASDNTVADNISSNADETSTYPNNAVNTLNTPPVLPDNPVNTLAAPPVVANNTPAPQNTAPDKKPVLAKSTPIVTTDSAKPAAPQTTEALPPIPREKSGANKFSVEIGGGYSFGWKYGDTNNGRSFIPTIGIGYTRKLSAKWAIKTGIQANGLNGLSNSSYHITHVNYDFGYNCNDTTVTTKWLVYLTIPLQVEYSLNDKNAIGLGGSASYLVTGWGMVNTQTLTYPDNTPPAPGQFNQYLYVKGYNKWDASVYLLYKRQFCTRFSAYVMPYFGLMDIKNNAFFGQNIIERNSGIKLLLSYTIY